METPAAIWAEYCRLEQIEKRRPEGQNVNRIIRTVAAQFEMPESDVADVVRRYTFTAPN